MDPLQFQAVNARRLARLIVLCVLPVAVLSGCVTLGDCGLPWTGEDRQRHGEVCQLTAIWNHEIVYAPDPTHGGQVIPGLTGRLYLFGKELKYPLVEEGRITVGLFDETPLAQGKPAVPLEEWRFDKDGMKQLLRHDTIGWGYTLVLPWGTYRPDIQQIRLKLRYDSAKTLPLFAESQSMMVNRPGTGTQITVTAKALH
jgi:hypothetical protein